MLKQKIEALTKQIERMKKDEATQQDIKTWGNIKSYAIEKAEKELENLYSILTKDIKK